MALRTSGLTAVAVLKRETIVQMGKDLSQKVACKSPIPCVREQLQIDADDPDLPDVFDYMRFFCVGKKTHAGMLFPFSVIFVKSKKRQMRFSAFAVASILKHDCPLRRVVVMERTHRGKPSHMFCPSP